MRFTENGPSIPDELLNARDEGRVVFFCGAGVSMERAKLPNFFGLAEAVIRELRIPDEDNIHKVLTEAREIGKRAGITGLISADRIFDLMDRQFEKQDIEVAVAKALAPRANPDVSAHAILLRLATTSHARIQLVTTNFDRLFESCDPVIKIHQPPRLPKPSRYDDLDGIVYLHGRVNENYAGSDGQGFVLSSSDFGYAYLSEGWATEFFRDIIRQFVVVFIGYTADDPPVHYLLEGLRRVPDSAHQMYSFDGSSSEEAIARWHQRGVKAISYSATDGHSPLWKALALWAERADDPLAWRQKTLALAKGGPSALRPYQRGQVVHIVSTPEGARDFADVAPPSEWLCVFDPSCRKLRIGRSDLPESEVGAEEPFSLFGIDSDVVPEKLHAEIDGEMNDVALQPWDAFVATRSDDRNLDVRSFTALNGAFAVHNSALPKRLAYLAKWIATVANQATTLWWATIQESLHPQLLRQIEWAIERPQFDIAPNMRQDWWYLIEAQESRARNPRREWFSLKDEINSHGWNSVTVRRFTAITRPYLSVGSIAAGFPPTQSVDVRLRDLIKLEVECPIPKFDGNIPIEWLPDVIDGQRQNIELAVRLCKEVDDLQLLFIAPIERDDRPDISDYERTHGLSGCMNYFTNLFNELVRTDALKATEEFNTWRASNDEVFGRLRFWAAGFPEVATANIFSRIVGGLDDDSFWNGRNQRDLLLVLSRRWHELSGRSKKRIEKRLLLGPPKWKREDETPFRERRAWQILDRLQWLADKGCKFTFDVTTEIAKLLPYAPQWNPSQATKAADSREGRGGMVEKNTDYDILLYEPIGSLLSQARELSTRDEDNFLKERDPFAGLCAHRPVRAYRALAHAARNNEYPKWAWNKFLGSPARMEDPPRLLATIALRLCYFRLNSSTSFSFLRPHGFRNVQIVSPIRILVCSTG
ncbi:MAG: SIR2 family protein [Planctomycetaceae bacterium]